jgi:uncharacterized peroxidase-related enzyme
MTYLWTVPEDEATGTIAEEYAHERQQYGYVMEATLAWTTRPEVSTAWGAFSQVVREGFTLSGRDWRLITLIAAKHIRSTYCSLVYGNALVADLGSVEQVIAVQRDFRNAGLEPRDVAMLEYAEKVTVDAPSIREADIERLREHGFTDQNIFDIALCASIRNLASRFFDAVGALPDAGLASIDPALRETMTVGRPFDATPDVS